MNHALFIQYRKLCELEWVHQHITSGINASMCNGVGCGSTLAFAWTIHRPLEHCLLWSHAMFMLWLLWLFSLTNQPPGDARRFGAPYAWMASRASCCLFWRNKNLDMRYRMPMHAAMASVSMDTYALMTYTILATAYVHHQCFSCALSLV